MEQTALAGQELIRLPGSPFWNIFKRFGRDEMIALVISMIGTFLVSLITASSLVLAFAGPVIEKFGFFPAHIWEAFKLYRATPLERRGPFWPYLRGAFKQGSVSLIEDVLVHDPLYIVLFLWLSAYPGIPLPVTVIFSFVVAVAIVAGLELAWTELRYANLRRLLKKAGFGTDHYREARFFIRTGQHAEDIIRRLQEGFSMNVVETLMYRDRYFVTGSPAFSGRSPVLRLRQRTAGKSDEEYNHPEHVVKTGYMQTVQLVYTLPQEEESGVLEQFRFFSVQKDKFYYPLDMPMPQSPDEIPSSEIRRLIRAGHEYKSLQFERTVMHDPTKMLYAGIDRGSNGEEGCIIELKVRKNVPLLLAAMRFVMRELPVTHTTMRKTEIALF